MARSSLRPGLTRRPKVVQDRYWRRWWRRKLWPILERWVRTYMRRKLIRREAPQRLELEKTFKTAVHWAQESKSWKHLSGAHHLFNVALHLLLAERDIQAMKLDALTHPDEWSRKLSARVIILTIVEWDIDKVTGQELRKALELIDPPEAVRTEITGALRHLRRTRDEAKKKYLELRNKTIAHRDPDALLVYRAIQELNVQEAMAVAGDFYVGVNAFMNGLTKLMLHSRSLDVALRMWRSEFNSENGHPDRLLASPLT